MRAIGILGGTFDPVHCGHVRLAIEVLEQAGLDEVRLMPAGAPRLRDPPRASGAERRAWLEVAVGGIAGLVVDPRELDGSGPTRTVETLESLRAEHPDDAIALVLGMDAFARLDEWHRHEALLELAHLVVARRPGADGPERPAVRALAAAHAITDARLLRAQPSGTIYLVEAPLLDISATDVRARIAAGRSIHCLVPDPVRRLIERSDVYKHGIR